MGSNPISGSRASPLAVDLPVLVSAAMSVPRKLSALFVAACSIVLGATAASAQVIVDPVVVAERNDGGWVYWIAIALWAPSACSS